MTCSFDSSSFEKGLSRYASSFLHSAENGLEEVAEQLKEKSVAKTPVDTGELRSRAFVSPVVAEENTMVVTVGYASESPEYAIYVHERTDVRHRVGQAKFLESSLHEIYGQFIQMIGRCLER